MSKSVPVQLAALHAFLGDDEINTICQQLGHTWRDRVFPPSTTVRSLLYRSLHPDKSISAALVDLAAADARLQGNPAAASWCQARDRLPEQVWPALIARSVRRIRRLVEDDYDFLARPVYLVDGSTLSMPDEPPLVEAFGYSPGRHGRSRFPVGRITFLTLAGIEAVVDYRIGPYRTGENVQFRAMWADIPSRAICIADKHFSSFYNFAKLRRRRIDMLCPLHQRRDPRKLIAAGKRVGTDQWIVKIALSPQSRKRYPDPSSLPSTLKMRLIRLRLPPGCRSRKMWLITTLLDTQKYTRGSLCRLYKQRWGIETRIGSLKSTLEMSVLRSKIPHAVRHEVAATVLAHNLTWTLIHQAAQRAEVPARRISFAGAIKTILAFSAPLRTSDTPTRVRVYNRMLDHIAHQTHPYRPGRTEPRRVKRDTVRYTFLRIPRHEARQKGLS
jgi:hypothetical protein